MENKAQVRKLRKVERDDERAQAAGLAGLLDSYEGRRFLWGLLAGYGVFQNPYGTSAGQTAFQCGLQQAGQQLLAQIIEVSHSAWLRMQEENAEYEMRKARLLTENDDVSDLDE